MGKEENKLQDKIIKYLQDNHMYHFRYNASSTYGIPDVIAVLRGYFIGIEVKREDGKGRASGLQKETVDTINSVGGYAAVVDSMEQFMELLSRVPA